MHRDIRLHGTTDQSIEYTVVAAGPAVHHVFLLSLSSTPENELRFFSGGNEFIIAADGVRHQGNGGSFCEYMFGVDQPISDLAREEVVNRLVMYGARYDAEGHLTFSDATEGEQSFDRIFFEGNAVCNYFFHVTSPALDGPLRNQQEELVRFLGRTIKRSTAVGAELLTSLLEELVPLLEEAQTQLFIFCLVNRKHREYRDLFQSLYFSGKKIVDADFARLTALAERHGIDRYQQERIRIDVMYKHPDNRRIVDEYRNILVSCHRRGEISTLDNARLTRLKTLSVRNKIPGALFHTLDEALRKESRPSAHEESDYLGETRQILEGIFLCGETSDTPLDREDLIRLLMAKKQAAQLRDHSFEEILLEATRLCDERIRDGADLSLLEGFSAIITYFDRYDATVSLISHLAFMENVRITEEIIRSLLGHRHSFNELKPGLFEELFVADLLENRYLGKYGRKKVTTLVRDLAQAEKSRLDIPQILVDLLAIDHEEQLFLTLLDRARERIRNLYARYSTREDQENLKREIAEELTHHRLLEEGIPDSLFRETIMTIRKEAVYLHTLLPRILAEENRSLREDFLENSGLDLFAVEELEREYCELNQLSPEILSRIRSGALPVP